VDIRIKEKAITKNKRREEKASQLHMISLHMILLLLLSRALYRCGGLCGPNATFWYSGRGPRGSIPFTSQWFLLWRAFFIGDSFSLCPLEASPSLGITENTLGGNHFSCSQSLLYPCRFVQLNYRSIGSTSRALQPVSRLGATLLCATQK